MIVPQEGPSFPSPGVSRRTFIKQCLAAGAAAGVSASLGGCGARRGGGRPNVLLVTLDTTRADRLSCYGYGRPTSPVLDALAAESVVYEKASSTASWTLPAHASLFTGKFTYSHGARYDAEGPLRLMDAIVGPKAWQHYRARGLAPDETTLAALLREAGYATGAVVAGPWLKKPFGLDRGFGHYDDEEIGTLNGRYASQVTFRAVDWIQAHAREEFFLFLNYFDPHAPYQAPEGYDLKFMDGIRRTPGSSSREELSALYDAEILYMDHHIGVLLDKLRDLRLYDNTWIIITADHGELLGEHGEYGHGHYLYEEELHVPLFMKYPAGEEAPRRTDIRLQLTDILPLVCRRLGITPPTAIQGTPPPEIAHPIIAETYPLRATSLAGDWRVIYDGNFKLHWSSQGHHMLFDLDGDPDEALNLIEADVDRAAAMTQALNDYLSGLPLPGDAGPAGEIDRDTMEALKGLGYVEEKRR